MHTGLNAAKVETEVFVTDKEHVGKIPALSKGKKENDNKASNKTRPKSSVGYKKPSPKKGTQPEEEKVEPKNV